MGWKEEDNKKLAALFAKKPSQGGVSAKDLSTKHIDSVHEKHFKQSTELKNFRPLFRKKARQWNLNRTLTGSRRSKWTQHNGIVSILSLLSPLHSSFI